MSASDSIKKELESLVAQVSEFVDLLKGELDVAVYSAFVPGYQAWYTKSLRLVQTFAPDRLAEFRSYYEIDAKRKGFSDSNYVIQDFVHGRGANTDPMTLKPYWDATNTLRLRLFGQAGILASVRSRIDGVLADIEATLAAEIEDSSLDAAEKLAKVSPRAAGALAGVLIEDHLQRVAKGRGVAIGKKNPTIADLNDPLKNAGVYDLPAWRRIQLLADLRNLCAHKKDREPTREEVVDLLAGARWVLKAIH